MLNDKTLIFPSLLSADFSRLGAEIVAIHEAGADGVHFDIMDGHFVPNLSMGPNVVKDLRLLSPLFFDVHLMIESVDLFIDPFIRSGADQITFHVEASESPLKLLNKIKSGGVKAGLSLKPSTPAAALKPFLEYVDMILIMTVDPGFGGQPFMESMLPKIKEIHKMVASLNRVVDIAVDGGITPLTAPLARAKGANVLIAGSAIFEGDSLEYGNNINALR